MVSGWGERENYARLLQYLAKSGITGLFYVKLVILFNPLLHMLYVIRPGLWS